MRAPDQNNELTRVVSSVHFGSLGQGKEIMAEVNRHWLPIRACAFRSYALCTAICLAAIVQSSDDIAQAAPITFRFDASVGSPRQGAIDTVPRDWNISLQEGDAISGTFTFEPFDAHSNTPSTISVQPFDFSIHIKTRVLTTLEYGIEVLDNRRLEDAPQPYDNVNVGCSFLGGGVECMPRKVSASEPIEWSFGFALFGEPTVFEGADIPSDSSTWQELVSDNSMLVSFKHPLSGWSYGFLAAIESFQLVPEPAGHGLFALASIIFFASISRLRKAIELAIPSHSSH
jgi:hypothetical protein